MDANQAEIVQALRKVGVTVSVTSAVGNGFPDLVCLFRGRLLLVEVKDGSKPPSAQRLTESEREFAAAFQPVYRVVTSPCEAINVVCAL